MDVVDRLVAWLRKGYPSGVPDTDFVPLLAILRRRLSDDEVLLVGRKLQENRLPPIDTDDIAVAIMRVTDELPSPDEIERVLVHLARSE